MRDGDPKREVPELGTRETLAYLEKLGNEIADYAKQAQIMLDIAKERGSDANLDNSERLQSFKPTGEFENQLVHLRAEAMFLSSELSEQGLKVTPEEVRARSENK